MIKISFNEPATVGWNNWKANCQLAITALQNDFANNRPLKISDLYKGQKAVYFDLHSNFYGKCAYCESLVAHSQPGDVEHYRPKGRITDSNNKVVMITKPDGTQIPHPGYYWLAYHHLNLLPSCTDCNRPSNANSGGTLIGKWDQFPVKGTNAVDPGDEVHEEPLLINPLTEEPDGHLEIDSIGILHAKDERGQKCIDLFGLNLREALVNERKNTYEDIKDKMMLLIIARMNGGQTQKYENEITAYRIGSKPYSVSGRKAIEDFSATLPVITKI